MAGQVPEEPKTMTEDDQLALLVRLDERTKQTADDVSQLKHVILEGNGSPPLTVQVARQDERIGSLEAKNAEAAGMSKSRLALYGTLGAATIGGLYQVISVLIKLIHG